ncbi:MAG TPA: SIMPL domain-containing protein [Dongiaceae bacterium]|jgi:uncharacterized protein YggE|nr:SIMPL domain-containing protein [Dongiaceae bacterium]
MKRLFIPLVLGLCVPLLQAAPELKGSPEELSAYLATLPKTTQITAQAELRVPADEALISLQVVTENRSLADALTRNQELRTEIISNLKSQGFAETQIQPSKFSSTPQYGFFGDKAKSYRVDNIVKVTTHTEKEFQSVARLVDSLGEVRYSGIEFQHSDKDKLKEQVMAQALEKVGKLKLIYEQKLQVRLTPINFREGQVSLVAPTTDAATQDSYTLREYPGSVARTGGPAKAPADPGATLFGEIVGNAAVTVEYSVSAQTPTR